jgi:hypothetical protein
MNRTLSLASLTLGLICACGHAHAQQDDENRTYGYPGQSGSGPAAPSTIPGRGDSNARVPDVRPAPSVQPKPRKPNAPASPWGGTVGTQTPNTAPMPNKPSTPPIASQPPVPQNGGTAKPPIAQNGGSGSTTTTPGASTPPPSQPQAGANDRLTSAYRGLGSSSAIIRNGGAAPVKGGSAGNGTAVATSAVLACTKNGNTPKITSVRPANEAALQPGQAFIVQGMCFGDGTGAVRVVLPTQYGRIQGTDAKVLDWQGDKILAQLPDGIVKAIPGAASVEIMSAAGARGPGKDVAFEPRWEKTALKDVEASIGACRLPNTPSTFHQCSIKNEGSRVVMKSTHWRGDIDLHPLRAGTDRYDLRMPDWMRPASCSITVGSSTTDGRNDGSATTRFEGKSAIVDWTFTPTADSEAFVIYDLSCDVWTPAGVVAS